MTKLAVFFHTRLSGGGMHTDTPGVRLPGVDPQWGRGLFAYQMMSLQASGLLSVANAVFIGVNGPNSDVEFIESVLPRFTKKNRERVQIVPHGPDAESLLPTMRLVQKFARENPDWFICFHHAKGATHPRDPLSNAWRECMEHHVIWNWLRCVADLELGLDTVGCHWIKDGKRDDPHLRQPKFWGGVYWWARAAFLNQCGPLPETVTKREDWFEPEWWIGSGPQPALGDYHPAWPSQAGCERSLRT
jgi:hypothetical protein